MNLIRNVRIMLKSISLMDITKADSMEKLSYTSIEKFYWSFY